MGLIEGAHGTDRRMSTTARLQYATGQRRNRAVRYLTGSSATGVSSVSSARALPSYAQAQMSRTRSATAAAGSAIDNATGRGNKGPGRAIPRGPIAGGGTRYARSGSPQVSDSLGTGLPSRGVEPNGNTIDYSSQRVNTTSVAGSIGDFLSSGRGSGSGISRGGSTTRRRYG